jgi:hypothetical protein
MRFLVRTVLILCVALGFAACNSNHVSVASPDGKNTAWLFTRDGGATTGYSKQVSIGNGKPGGIGNIYVQGGDEEVTLRWLSDTHLEITTDPDVKPIKNEKTFGKITISYKRR